MKVVLAEATFTSKLSHAITVQSGGGNQSGERVRGDGTIITRQYLHLNIVLHCNLFCKIAIERVELDKGFVVR